MFELTYSIDRWEIEIYATLFAKLQHFKLGINIISYLLFLNIIILAIRYLFKHIQALGYK